MLEQASTALVKHACCKLSEQLEQSIQKALNSTVALTLLKTVGSTVLFMHVNIPVQGLLKKQARLKARKSAVITAMNR